MPRHRSRNRDTLRQLASRAVEGGPACTHGLAPTPRVSVDAKLLLLPPSTAHTHTHMHRHRHAHTCAHVCSHTCTDTRTHTSHTYCHVCTRMHPQESLFPAERPMFIRHQSFPGVGEWVLQGLCGPFSGCRNLLCPQPSSASHLLSRSDYASFCQEH